MRRHRAALWLLAVWVVLAAWSAGAQSYAPIVVSGAGSPEVNGTYTYDGNLNGKPTYVKGSYSIEWFASATSYWKMGLAGYVIDYYCNLGDTPTPPAAGWQGGCGAVSDGNLPYPTLTGGEEAHPEIDVRGNGLTITDGDGTPSLADHTDFGTVRVAAGSVTRSFAIHNVGTGDLAVGAVALSGSADFAVTVQPAATVSAGTSTTFSVRFDPSADGVRTGTVQIPNDDADENPYTFAIQGTGDGIGPTVASVTPSVSQISDATVGPGGFAVTVTWSEAMDTAVSPGLTFLPSVADTLALDGGVWLDAQTFRVTYSVSDAGVDRDGVTVDVIGARDATGNAQQDYTPEAEFGIDTENPTVTVAIVDASLSDTDPVSSVTFTFSEATTDFAAGDLAAVGGVISAFGGSGTSYSATFTATDGYDGTGSVTVGAGSYTDAAGNLGETGSDTVDIDRENPTVAISADDVAIYDGDVGADRFVVTATFSEVMSPAIVPSLVFLPGMATTFTNPSGAWSVGNTVYTWTYDVTDDGAMVLDVDLMVSGGADVFGNTQIANSRTDYIDVDLQNPTVAISANDVAIYDGDVGADRFVVTATFSEAMNPAVVPNLSFTPAVATTFTNPSGAWSDSNTVYTWTYDEADATVTVADVDVTVSGGQDVAGNTQVANTDADYVDIDTRNPVATVTADHTLIAGGSPIYEGSLTLTVTVAYDEAMDTSTVPTITLPGGGTHWGAQTAVGWVGNMTYHATFTHDGTEEPTPPAPALVASARVASASGARDLAGNADVGDDSPVFDIDTRKPRATVTTNRTTIAGGSPVYEQAASRTLTVTVTYDEAMDPSTTPAIALVNAGSNWTGPSSGGWTSSTVYTAQFTHNGAQEEIENVALARVADGSGATDLAGNADVGDDSPVFDIDTRKPRATVTVDRTMIADGAPVFEDALVLTVTVTYDEAMNPTTQPAITLPGGGANWGVQTPVGWSAGDTVYRATFTHNGTEEPTPPAGALVALARVANTSGAQDRAGNADVGDDSPSFEIDTRKPELTPGVAAVAVDTDPVYEGDLVQVVTVTFDEAMRSDGTAEPTITFSHGTWISGAAGAWSSGDTIWTRTYTVVDNDEEVADVTVDVTGARDAAGNAQENYVPVREFTLDTLQPWIVRIDADGEQACGGFYCSGAGDTVVVFVTFSEGVELHQAPFSIQLDVLPDGFEHEFPMGAFSPNPALPGRWDDYTIEHDYVVQAGHNSCDLESTAATWVAGELTDIAGNLAIVGMPPAGQRIAALEDIIVDTEPPLAIEDPRSMDAYVFVRPTFLSSHEFVEDRERILVREDCPIYIDVLANDHDNCHAGLSVLAVDVPAPAYGWTSRFTDGGAEAYPLLPGACDARVVRYEPSAGYSGPDEFGYTARDCSGNVSDARVSLYVFAKNVLASAVTNAFSGVPAPFVLETRDDLLLRIADPGRFRYAFAVPGATEHGVLAWTESAVWLDSGRGATGLSVVYTSAIGYEGPDGFAWSVTDPFGVTQEVWEAFLVVAGDASLTPLEPSLRLTSADVVHLAVPDALFALGGISALRIERVGVLGDVLGEVTRADVVEAVAPALGLGPSVLRVDLSKLPAGRLRIRVPMGDGTECAVLLDTQGGEQ